MGDTLSTLLNTVFVEMRPNRHHRALAVWLQRGVFAVMPCYVRGCHEIARRRVNHPRFGRVGSCATHDPDPNRLLVETNTHDGHAIAESCLREARQHFDNALVFWKLLHDKNSLSIRHACFRAYHSGLLAATTMLGMPFSGLDADRCNDPVDHMIAARRLLSERRLNVDIEPYLLELRNRTADGEGRLLLNLDRFLDEVAALLHPPVTGASGPIEIRLPELPSAPGTVVLVGPVGIDEAIAVVGWG